MNRSALVFLAGVFVPSLVLGWLAVQTIDEQQIILEKRTAEVFQTQTEAVAGMAREVMRERSAAFSREVSEFLAEQPAQAAADMFSKRQSTLSREAVLFALSANGHLVVSRNPDAKTVDFLRQNELFLAGGVETEVYQVPLTRAEAPLAQIAPSRSEIAPSEKQADRMDRKVVIVKPELGYDSDRSAESKSKMDEAAASVSGGSRTRNVMPQKVTESQMETQMVAQLAAITPEVSDFRNATSGAAEGILARFVNDTLQWFFWSRPPEGGGITFGCMVPAVGVKAWMNDLPISHPELCLAVLDERARPVFVSIPGFETDWRRPFVATEIGDLLPYWEATAYLRDPGMLNSAASTSRIVIFSVIALALAAILAAGYFVVRDTRRQLDLAAKKTGFVSNVSHELKTPLTSIRMFAELLEAGAIAEPEKRNKYLRIITLESERLTRLINNVLDFAKMDKKGRTYSKKPIDLHPLIARLWDGTCLHLSASGWTCEWHAADPPYMVTVDADAISQVLVNLLSNAEKYGASAKEITLHTWKESGFLHVGILDRGPGVPQGEERKIFEAFYRANDSLSSGIPGSGLGLTLAMRIAKDHGGEIVYANRVGGGSHFTLRIPLREDVL